MNAPKGYSITFRITAFTLPQEEKKIPNTRFPMTGMAEEAAKSGFLLSYDGMEIDF